MKKFNVLFAAALAASLSIAGALANTSPSLAKIKVYGVAISQNADCSGAQVIGYNPSGTTYDLLTNPALVSGAIAPGTYSCMILYMDDLLTFVPAANDGTHCVAGVTYQRIICNNSNSTCNFTTGRPDASNIVQFTGTQASTASSSSDLTHVDKVLLFLSTQSVGNGSGPNGSAFRQPTTAGSGNGIKLNGALTVSSSGGTGTFVINFNNQVRDSGSDCDLGPPVFSFR